MDKTFIMKLDDTNDLLGKEPPTMGITPHPVAFPLYHSVCVKRRDAVATILEHLENYQDRQFYITPDNYGVDVSVNYADGKFISMILKGTGEEGDRIHEAIATMVVPKESKNKKKVTLHAILTMDRDRDTVGEPIYEVPRIIKRALRDGFERYQDKKIVIRVLRLYIDGEETIAESVWQVIGNMLIAGYSLNCDYYLVKSFIEKDFVINHGYQLPQRGIIIRDETPSDEKAFPETHFLFDDDIIVENT